MGWVPRVHKEAPAAFISYRRDDTAAFAQRLARGLKEDLDRARVFLDVLDIPATASDWWAVTEERLRTSDAAVMLIGPGFLTQDTGSDDPPPGGASGWALHEARTARDAGIPLIRVLVDREVPPAEAWPADLQPLFGPRAQYLIADSSDAGISSAQQQVLAGVWVALVSRVIGEDGTVYVVSDGTPEAGHALDLLLNQIPRAAHVTSEADLPEAAGFRAVARADVERQFSQTLPDVIIVTRGEPTDTLRDRLRGMAACEAFAATASTIISASAVTGAVGPTVDTAALQEMVTDEIGSVTNKVATTMGNLAPRPARPESLAGGPQLLSPPRSASLQRRSPPQACLL